MEVVLFKQLKKDSVDCKRLCGYTHNGGCDRIPSDIESFTIAKMSLPFPSDLKRLGIVSSN